MAVLEGAPKRLACIAVGSGAHEMLIAETRGGPLRSLEVLRRDGTLGRDCYAEGVLSRLSIQETTGILSGFCQILQEYQIDELAVVATSAIREAANRDFVVDQIYHATGLKVEVIDNALESAYIYSALNEEEGFKKLKKEGLLIVDVGYGSTQISKVIGGRLVLSHNVKVGALRLWELIASVAKDNSKYPELLEQYIIAELNHIPSLFGLNDIRHCAATSAEALYLIGMMEERPTLKKYQNLYTEVKSMTPERMEMRFGISKEHAEILLPTMMVVKAFTEMTRADALNLFHAPLVNGVVASMRDRIFSSKKAQRAEAHGKLVMARMLAESMGANMEHARDVDHKAAELFDALYSLHGLAQRERLLLRLAAVMHDMGKRISTVRHGAQSARIFRANPLVGLNERDAAVIAFIMEHHALKRLDEYRALSKTLPEGERTAAAKLLAILMLADALDARSKQKLTILSVEIEGGDCVIRVKSDDDALLEKFVFLRKRELFAQVFVRDVQLKIQTIV